jgi:hypothetical protein
MDLDLACIVCHWDAADLMLILMLLALIGLSLALGMFFYAAMVSVALGLLGAAALHADAHRPPGLPDAARRRLPGGQ